MAEFDNAVLVEIATPGPAGLNGDPGAPVSAWTGRAGGYLKRDRKNIISGGVQVRVQVDTFTVLRSEGVAVIEAAGADWEASTVVIEDMRTGAPVVRRFTVNAMENRAAGTIVDSLRLELNAETAA